MNEIRPRPRSLGFALWELVPESTKVSDSIYHVPFKVVPLFSCAMDNIIVFEGRGTLANLTASLGGLFALSFAKI